LLTDKQTKVWQKHYLLGGGNKMLKKLKVGIFVNKTVLQNNKWQSLKKKTASHVDKKT